MPASWSVDIATATLAVARKLVAYLLAVDKSGQAFHSRLTPEASTQKAA
jgi:hypothetical protein